MGKLIDAVSAGKLPEVQKMLAGEYRNSPHTARNGNLAIVQISLKAGAKIDRPNKKWETPLMIADQKGHKDVVQLLQKPPVKVKVANPASPKIS